MISKGGDLEVYSEPFDFGLDVMGFDLGLYADKVVERSGRGGVCFSFAFAHNYFNIMI